MSSVKYEIKKTEYRGFGMFATEKIQAGELIIKEEFIFKLCQQYSNVKQKLDDIEANLSSLSTEKRKTFFCFRMKIQFLLFRLKRKRSMKKKKIC